MIIWWKSLGFFQLKADRLDFFPLNRALCLSGKDDDSAEAKLDDLIASVQDLVRHQNNQVSFSCIASVKQFLYFLLLFI